MIWAFAITSGFSREIRDKVVGFGSHIEVHYFDNNTPYEKKAITKESAKIDELKKIPNVKYVQSCASKAGIIQTEEEIEGIVFKGIGSDYQGDFFSKNIVKGCFPSYNDSLTSNNIVISEKIASKLKLDTGMKIHVYFVQQPVRQRNFKICGIYNTGLGKYDETYAICDIRHIQKLNNLRENQVDAVEIILENFDELDESCEYINKILPYDLTAETTKEINSEIFDWMGLFDQNIAVLIILITLVVCITLISTQLTLVLEQISNIGILKTMGVDNKSIRNIFLYISGRIVLKGLITGNAIALFVCFLQNKTHIIKLNPDNYFVDYVPMLCRYQHIIGINIFILLICMLVLILPTYYISRKINTITAIQTT